jgi:hypothetical protein
MPRYTVRPDQSLCSITSKGFPYIGKIKSLQNPCWYGHPCLYGPYLLLPSSHIISTPPCWSSDSFPNIPGTLLFCRAFPRDVTSARTAYPYINTILLSFSSYFFPIYFLDKFHHDIIFKIATLP